MSSDSVSNAPAASETPGTPVGKFGSGGIGSIVPLGRDIFLRIPGTSCLATIVLSLRDKTIHPSKRLAIIGWRLEITLRFWLSRFVNPI